MRAALLPLLTGGERRQLIQSTTSRDKYDRCTHGVEQEPKDYGGESLGGSSRRTEHAGTLAIRMRAKNRQWHGPACDGQEPVSGAIEQREYGCPGGPCKCEHSCADRM